MKTNKKPCDAQVEGIDVAGASASISTLDFSPTSLSLAIGNEYGLVRSDTISRI